MNGSNGLRHGTEKESEPLPTRQSNGTDQSGQGEHETSKDVEMTYHKPAKFFLEEDAGDFMEMMSLRMNPEESMRPQTSFFDTLEQDIEADIESGQQSAGAMVERRSSLIRFQKIIKVSIEWEDLTYTVTVGRRKNKKIKTILDNISAQVPAGRLVAVMGPTGCGKTSLINALAGRVPVGATLSGNILINGRQRGRGFRAISAYVMQDDALFSNLTVRETFEFSARMRLPSTVSEATKMSLVTQIISELGLTKASNTRIGSEFVRGVSGGERKRTNIGIELLSGASLLFLDEPTSGLDAFQAQNVMESLWALAGNGRTVITTIHQPRSSIYQMVDLLLLLSEGKLMYFGPAKTATVFFGEAGFKCPEHYNPADFMIDVISMDFRNKELEKKSKERIELFSKFYEEEGSDINKRLVIPAVNAEEMEHFDRVVSFPNGRLAEFWLLLNRSWKQQSRDRLPQAITIIQTIVIGFTLAFLYMDMNSSATSGQDEIGLLFFCAIFAAFNAMFGALNSFPAERGVVNRERASKMYHVMPYYFARFICDIPLRVGQGVLFGVIVYWIVGLNPAASSFFVFVCIIIVIGLASQGLGVAVSAGAKNEKVALALAPAVTVILILFGGFYVNEGTIPVWLSWIKYISHLYWGFMALIINDFKDRDGWKCSPTAAEQSADPNNCTVTGNEIIKTLGFNPSDLWLAFVGLFALVAGLHSLGYIFLRRSKTNYLPLDAIQSKKKA